MKKNKVIAALAAIMPTTTVVSVGIAIAEAIGRRKAVNEIYQYKKALISSLESEAKIQEKFSEYIDYISKINMDWDFTNSIDTDNEIFVNSDKIFVSFRFDLYTYESWVVLTGRTYDKSGKQLSSNEMLIPTPQIPLIGGCWSNSVAMRMLRGQELVSMMLDEVYYWLKYAMKFYIHYNIFYYNPDRKTDIEIIKIDRCLYAPFLYLTEENVWDDENDDGDCEKIYMDFLTENYPEAYQNVQKHSSFTEYLREYHDKDVETVF